MLRFPVSRRLAALSAGVTVAALAGVGASTALSAPAHAAASKCTSAHTQIWLGDGRGGGTAGTTYYPLEFTNVGHSSCTLVGYPGVSAFGLGFKSIAGGSRHITLAHSTVTLAAGATAYALLGIEDWGAVCSKAVNALGLKVFGPNQKVAKGIDFPMKVCAHHSLLKVGPVRSGVGIPGFSGP